MQQRQDDDEFYYRDGYDDICLDEDIVTEELRGRKQQYEAEEWDMDWWLTMNGKFQELDSEAMRICLNNGKPDAKKLTNVAFIIVPKELEQVIRNVISKYFK